VKFEVLEFLFLNVLKTFSNFMFLFRRRAKSLVSAHLKTTEQLQLEKVAELQKDMARKIEKNIESCRTALAGRVLAPVHASMPTTKTEEFHFETDSRVKDHSTTYNNSHEVDFASMLRKNNAPSVSFTVWCYLECTLC